MENNGFDGSLVRENPVGYGMLISATNFLGFIRVDRGMNSQLVLRWGLM